MSKKWHRYAIYVGLQILSITFRYFFHQKVWIILRKNTKTIIFGVKMITPRLKCIINNTHGKKIADIGTDHAYIPIYMIENSLADYFIASDVREGPISIANENIKEHKLSDKIETRLGSGLSILNKNEADTIIIAGMGGQLISEIIEADIDIAKNAELTLQPMNAQYELRKYLIKNGFTVTREDIAVEGFKVYNIFNVKYERQSEFENDIEYHLPKYLKGHKYYHDLYDKKHREFSKVILGLKNSKNTDKEKLRLYEYWLEELEKYEG